jgi:hypothetical protein
LLTILNQSKSQATMSDDDTSIEEEIVEEEYVEETDDEESAYEEVVEDDSSVEEQLAPVQVAEALKPPHLRAGKPSHQTSEGKDDCSEDSEDDSKPKIPEANKYVARSIFDRIPSSPKAKVAQSDDDDDTDDDSDDDDSAAERRKYAQELRAKSPKVPAKPKAPLGTDRPKTPSSPVSNLRPAISRSPKYSPPAKAVIPAVIKIMPPSPASPPVPVAESKSENSFNKTPLALPVKAVVIEPAPEVSKPTSTSKSSPAASTSPEKTPVSRIVRNEVSVSVDPSLAAQSPSEDVEARNKVDRKQPESKPVPTETHVKSLPVAKDPQSPGKNIGWEKPSWAQKGPPKLRSTGKGEVLKTSGNLAAPITNLPHLKEAFAKPEWLLDEERQKLRDGFSKQLADKGGRFERPVTSLPTTVTGSTSGSSSKEIGWAKPDWATAKGSQLKGSDQGEKLRSGETISRPIGGIKPIEN